MGKQQSIKKPHALGENITYWTPAGAMPIDLFSCVREAGRAFHAECYMAAIAMSSALVEIVINKDSRTRAIHGMRRIDRWATLNNANLRVGEENGLPVEELLNLGESLKSRDAIEFVKYRNKVAHGDTDGIFTNLTDYDPIARKQAEKQLSKARKFLHKWFNTAPDVQQLRIKNHRWPR